MPAYKFMISIYMPVCTKTPCIRQLSLAVLGIHFCKFLMAAMLLGRSVAVLPGGFVHPKGQRSKDCANKTKASNYLFARYFI